MKKTLEYVYQPIFSMHLTMEDIWLNEVYTGHTFDPTNAEKYISRTNTIVSRALEKAMR